MALIPPFYIDCVTAIGFRDQAGQINYGATGFLYGKLVIPGKSPVDSIYRVYLVTNKHVFEGEHAAVLRFNPQAGAPARTFDISLVDVSGVCQYSVHPDPDVDVAAMYINIDYLRSQNIQIEFFCSDRNIVTLAQARIDNLSEGNGVFVLGFPMGQTGNERNYVIVRQGILARVRDAILGASPTFLVDASIFPGNSGGPVVTKPEIVAIDGTTPYPNSRLIGMVSQYLPYQDFAVSNQTKRPRVIFEENSGLGVVVPVDRIIEVVDIADGLVVAHLAVVNAATPPGAGPATTPPAAGQI